MAGKILVFSIENAGGENLVRNDGPSDIGNKNAAQGNKNGRQEAKEGFFERWGSKGFSLRLIYVWLRLRWWSRI